MDRKHLNKNNKTYIYALDNKQEKLLKSNKAYWNNYGYGYTELAIEQDERNIEQNEFINNYIENVYI